MSNLLAHGGMFMAGNTLLVFLPFIVAGAGLAFIMRAFTDKVDRRPDDDGPTWLPTREERPLYHVHMQIRSGAKPASASRATGPTVAKLRHGAEPGRRRAGRIAGILFATFIGLATTACIGVVIWYSEKTS